jgi:6,7-dimethyl-8-ribityllumazine synthase
MNDMAKSKSRYLIIDARFYEDIADELVAGARQVLEAEKAEIDRISVPGVLELPTALALALEAVEEGQRPDYEGYILLGCVIRGETSHYDIVAGESARSIMDLTVDLGLALGNGILTVENCEQAEDRSSREKKNKGADAARAAIALAKLKRELGLRHD